MKLAARRASQTTTPLVRGDILDAFHQLGELLINSNKWKEGYAYMLMTDPVQLADRFEQLLKNWESKGALL